MWNIEKNVPYLISLATYVKGPNGGGPNPPKKKLFRRMDSSASSNKDIATKNPQNR